MLPSPRRRVVRHAGLVLLLGTALAACSSTRYALDFTPSPAEILVPPEGGGEPAAARLLVSVQDAERAFDDDSAPFELRLRMRIENLGTEELGLQADQILLVNAELLAFLSPRLVAHDEQGGLAERKSVRLAPGATGLYDLAFPLTDGAHPQDLDLEGLNLRWTLLVGQRPVLLSASFSRQHRSYARPYDDPFFGPPFHSSLHFGTSHWH